MYFVSRQCYWGVEEPYVVEIADGGLDYANPDMLADDVEYRSLGCGREYKDPRAAMRAALRIRRVWEKNVCGAYSPRIEVGWTGGNTVPFEEYPTAWQLYKWAQAEYEALPKCEHCGEILSEKFKYTMFGYDEEFCSEYCADEFWREMSEDLGEEWQ